MGLTPEQQASFDRWLRGRSRYPLLCAACFNEIPLPGEDIVVLPTFDPTRPPDAAPQLVRMVRVICPLCGHVMLFDATALEWD